METDGPAAIHRAVEAAFNAGDVDALVALYEPEARMVQPDGSVAVGADAIRNDWTFKAEGLELSSRTSEVVRRQADGGWRYVVDHPFGASDDIP